MDPNHEPDHDRDADDVTVDAEDGSTAEGRPEPDLPDEEAESLGNFA